MGELEERETQRFEDWLLEQCPIDLGDGEHRVGWKGEPGASDLWFLHRCGGYDGKRTLAWIDVTSGQKHRLESIDPLHVEASIACPVEGCTDHGYIRAGAWSKA